MRRTNRSCPKCDRTLERYRIGRGANRRGAGAEVAFCPTCNHVVSAGPAAGSAGPVDEQVNAGYRPAPRRDLDE